MEPNLRTMTCFPISVDRSIFSPSRPVPSKACGRSPSPMAARAAGEVAKSPRSSPHTTAAPGNRTRWKTAFIAGPLRPSRILRPPISQEGFDDRFEFLLGLAPDDREFDHPVGIEDVQGGGARDPVGIGDLERLVLVRLVHQRLEGVLLLLEERGRRFLHGA